MSEKIYPKGITFFAPRAGAPEFVRGEVIVNANEFYDWMQANKHLLVEHEKYGKQFKFSVTDKGMQVNTWKPNSETNQKQQQRISKPIDESLPF